MVQSKENQRAPSFIQFPNEKMKVAEKNDAPLHPSGRPKRKATIRSGKFQAHDDTDNTDEEEEKKTRKKKRKALYTTKKKITPKKTTPSKYSHTAKN